MRIFMMKDFYRWLRKSGLSESDLLTAVAEMESGLIDADLGGSVYKKRIAIPGRGKRGGARTIVALKFGERCIFLYGYAKNELENITPNREELLRRTAAHLLNVSDATISESLADGFLKEVIT